MCGLCGFLRGQNLLQLVRLIEPVGEPREVRALQGIAPARGLAPQGSTAHEDSQCQHAGQGDRHPPSCPPGHTGPMKTCTFAYDLDRYWVVRAARGWTKSGAPLSISTRPCHCRRVGTNAAGLVSAGVKTVQVLGHRIYYFEKEAAIVLLHLFSGFAALNGGASSIHSACHYRRIDDSARR